MDVKSIGSVQKVREKMLASISRRVSYIHRLYSCVNTATTSIKIYSFNDDKDGQEEREQYV